MEVLQDRARRLLRILDVKLIQKDKRKGGGVQMFGIALHRPHDYEKEKTYEEMNPDVQYPRVI